MHRGRACRDEPAQTVEDRLTHALVHGDDPAVVFASGTTDARFYRNRARIPALCYGPRVRNIHAANEAVELQSIVEGARTLTRLIPAWCEDG